MYVLLVHVVMKWHTRAQPADSQHLPRRQAARLCVVPESGDKKSKCFKGTRSPKWHVDYVR